jgi:5'-nucleotidase
LETEINKTPLILVTNDDGYFASGLKSLINMVEPLGEVLVVAPEQSSSGMSHAITIKVPLRVSKIKQSENVTIYKVNGTPVDCVKIGIEQLAERKPDIIVSGINHGSNSSINIVYSGTMGAAIEGYLNGIPSVGFSLCSYDSNADFSLVEEYGKDILLIMLKRRDNICLNVNFPDIDKVDFRGTKVCRQAKGVWREKYEKRIDPLGGSYYWLTGKYINLEPESTDTDEWALNNGYASIVPIDFEFTDFKKIDDINELNKEISDE